ncbi:unnamed protein product [Oikopleura dioica]|uniref:Protein phosphatase 1 regulatory subunit 35 C-terminal domain-containing protein n=1 Tax=Oikopleura dioica TaxID=34765 RepID=E4Y8D9_OIKDI|nr:unnamed protein product [Oikopleura dioica]
MDKSIERDAPVPSVRSSTGGLTEELDISDIEDEEQTDASTIRSLTASTAPSDYRSRTTVTKSSDLEITQIDPPSYSRASHSAPGSFKKSSDLEITTFDEGIPDIPLVATNSTQLLVQNIASIKQEKFNAKEHILKSEVLKKSVRDKAVQELNFDPYDKIYKDLVGLDVNKENLIEQEIKDRLGRVEKVEMAKAIKCSYGEPNIRDFEYMEQTSFGSLTMKNHAFHLPQIEDEPSITASEVYEKIQEAIERVSPETEEFY